MATAFEAAAARASGVLDARGGELFDLIAMKSPGDVDARRVPDPNRLRFTVKGIWFEPSRSVLPKARGSTQDDNAQRQVASAPRVSIDDVNMIWPATIGDLVMRHKTGETFEIARPVPDGARRTFYSLTARRRL